MATRASLCCSKMHDRSVQCVLWCCAGMLVGTCSGVIAVQESRYITCLSRICTPATGMIDVCLLWASQNCTFPTACVGVVLASPCSVWHFCIYHASESNIVQVLLWEYEDEDVILSSVMLFSAMLLGTWCPVCHCPCDTPQCTFLSWKCHRGLGPQ